MERIGNAWIYPVDLHGKANAIVTKCIEGYTVYVDRNLPPDKQREACRLELDHIEDHDFEKTDVNVIEIENHEVKHGDGETTAFREMENTTDG